jgi:lambda family phage portal protein
MSVFKRLGDLVAGNGGAAPELRAEPTLRLGGGSVPAVARRSSPSRRPGVRAAGFDAADTGRLFSTWGVSGRTTDVFLKAQLVPMRYRSRDLARNNDYARAFLGMLERNVVGPKGIRVKNRAKHKDGSFDKDANDRINASWFDWGSLKQYGAIHAAPTLDGTQSWLDVQRMAVRSLARDGEIFVRKVKGAGGNPYRYALQFLAPELLDPLYNRVLDAKTRVHMGIEMDRETRRRKAYWFRTFNPESDMTDPADYQALAYTRVPAEEIIHVFVREDAEQNRGIPWLATPATRAKMLGAYEEAELVAARASASKGGFYQKKAGAGDTPPASAAAEDAGGEGGGSVEFVQSLEAGTYEIVPEGWEFVEANPQHPTVQFGSFVKNILRAISAGLGVSYHGLANDLEGVNYSSIRQGTIEERDAWRLIQAFMVEHFVAPIYERLARMVALDRRRRAHGAPGREARQVRTRRRSARAAGNGSTRRATP